MGAIEKEEFAFRIHPSIKINIDCSFKDNNGRSVLTTTQFNNTKLSLCNICAPNNLTEQVQFIQDLNCLLMDKSELATLIVGSEEIGTALWKTVLNHFFGRYRGLELMLNCTYDVNYFQNLPQFYKEILTYFSDLKTLYKSNLLCTRDIILFSNKEILVGGKPFFRREWSTTWTIQRTRTYA